MSQPPQEPWDRPHPGWGQQPPPWGQQPHPGQSWGQPPAARSAGGQVTLMVLGLVTAVLTAVGAFLPSYTSNQGLDTYGPLFQTFGGSTTFMAPGLTLLACAVLLVVGSLLLLRPCRAVGAGLVLFGAGLVVHQGGGNLLALLQSQVGEDISPDIAAGAVVLMLAALAGTAAAVLALVTLARTRA